MSIDSILRDTLQSYADHAPSNAGLLDEVRVRSRRRRTRRSVLVAGAAVVTAGGLAAAATVYGGAGGEPVSPATRPPVALSEPSFDLPPFPFSPGWTPDGFEERYVFYQSGLDRESSLAVPEGWGRSSEGPRSETDPPRSELTMIQAATDPPVESPLSADIYATNPTAWLESISVDQRDLRVQGRPAISYQIGDGGEIVAWRHEPGRWVGVTADQSLAPQDAARYARELIAEPTPVTLPFDFELLPSGMDLTFTTDTLMNFADEEEGWLTVGLWSVREFPERVPEQDSEVEVNGRAAGLTEGAHGSVLYIPIDQDLIVEVRGTLNRHDLLRVAEGMTLTPDARQPPSD